ncbi:hypothetical protein BDFB_002490, partial [Asbolus verrucosus]
QREVVIKEGPCKIGVCGEEAACKDFRNNTHTCVCTHDSRPPTARGTCPRKIVPVDPGRIPNVQPPSNKQSPSSLNSTVPIVSPINLKHSLLMAERYAPNPQYSACSGTGVPLLRKETLKFINEIGEGCFGKVYK